MEVIQGGNKVTLVEVGGGEGGHILEGPAANGGVDAKGREDEEAGDAEGLLLPPDAGLPTWPMIELNEAATQRFTHGNPVEVSGSSVGLAWVYGPAGRLLGLGETDADKQLKPKRIFNL